MSDTAPWTPNEAVAFLNRALDRWAEQSGTSVSIEAGNVVGLRDFIIEWSRRDAVASSCAAVPALTREQIAQAIRDSNPHMGESPEMIALTLHYADAILAMPRAAAPSPTGGATDRAAAAVSAANYGNWDSLHYTAGTQVDTTCQEMDIWDLATKLFTQSAHNATSDPVVEAVPSEREAVREALTKLETWVREDRHRMVHDTEIARYIDREYPAPERKS